MYKEANMGINPKNVCFLHIMDIDLYLYIDFMYKRVIMCYIFSVE
jgi:hypothetical protein